jgi:hypothetical protein
VKVSRPVVAPEDRDELYAAHVTERQRAQRIEGHAGRVESVDEEPRR